MTERGLKVRTVDEWIQKYEEYRGYRKPPAKKEGRGNLAGSATLTKPAPEPEILPSDQPDRNGREAVSAIFVLTTGQLTKQMSSQVELGRGATV